MAGAGTRFAGARGAPRLLLALPGASAVGGLEAFNRQLIAAAGQLAAERGGAVEVLALNDEPGSRPDARYLADRTAFTGFGRDKAAMARALLIRVARFRPHGVIFGHVNLAPLALAVRPVPRLWRWFVIHGIEAWIPLPPHKRWALGAADRVLAVSRHTLDETARLNQLDPGRMVVFPNALDPAWVAARGAVTSEAGARDPRAILTVTRLADTSRGKGVDHVLRALLRVREAVPGVRYTIVGDGPDRARLEALADELGVRGQVTFAGRVSDEALDRAYRTHGVFVMPSQNEGFGIVFLEAGVYGLPSVGGDYAGAREAIVEGVTGYRVVQEPAVIAERLVRLLRDPDAARAMGDAAREHVLGNYTFDHFRTRLARELVEPRGPVPATRREPGGRRG